MFVVAFVKGLHVNPFNESLIWCKAECLAKIRARPASHIEAEPMEVISALRV